MLNRKKSVLYLSHMPLEISLKNTVEAYEMYKYDLLPPTLFYSSVVSFILSSPFH